MGVHIVDKIPRPEHHDEVIVLMDDFGKELRHCRRIGDANWMEKLEEDVKVLERLEREVEEDFTREGIDVEELKAPVRIKKQERMQALAARRRKPKVQASAGGR